MIQPALAQANIACIAMGTGTGTDVAIQNAGVTLIKSDLMEIVRLDSVANILFKL